MRRALRDRVRQKVLVSLKTGDGFSGVLWDWDRECFVLRNAVHVAPEQEPTPADGEVVVLAADVAYVQFP